MQANPARVLAHAFAFVFAFARADAQSTFRVSVDSQGAQGDLASLGQRTSMSADGRLVAFQSRATNLTAGDTNGVSDVFVHDRLTAQTFRVSSSPLGAVGNGASVHPSLSADGRFVVFDSDADNLVAGDTNGNRDVFVHELATGLTERVSVGPGGQQTSMFGSGQYGSLSADGRFVAFMAYALPGGPIDNQVNVYVRDRFTGVNHRASRSFNGTPNDGSSSTPALSADGRWVVFYSAATQLVSGDSNGASDIFLHDVLLDQTTCVSVTPSGAHGNSGCGVLPSISSDGRWVAFVSAASDLVPGDTNGVADVFVFDRTLQSMRRVSVGASGQQGNLSSDWPEISGDGRFVAFASGASNLVPSDTNGVYDVFSHDMLSGLTTRVSVSGLGEGGDEHSFAVSLDHEGRYVAFLSEATNLVQGDTNGMRDTFVRDVFGPCESVVYCTSSTTVQGCTPAIGAQGVASSFASGGFVLSVVSAPGLRTGLIFYGAATQSAPWASGSTSVLCVQPPHARTGNQSSGGTAGACDGEFSLDWNAWRAAHPGALGSPFAAGEQFHAQCWFRDPGAPTHTNLSNALSFTLCQ
jgi:Tol biopolymer transport system component